ncbi:hypothetical protein BaRGS_00010095 [Batillaria attramentaria]|uniref:Uncharacterized protein n=1 Tax=Batillaria attramentaria TaxID=370345 RepID=A0ABD0LHP5_9CAEN
MMAEAKTADSKAPRLSALSANLSGKSLASTPSHSFFLAASKKETSLLSVPSTSQFEATSQSCSSVTSMMDKLNLGHAKHTRSTNVIT